MSSDMRLVNIQTGKPQTELSTKQFIFKTTEGIATVSYCGIGRLADGPQISDLLVRLLQGESRSFAQTLNAIRGFSNEQIAPVAWSNGIEHSFLVAGLVNGEPAAGAISNLKLIRLGYPDNETELLKQFELIPASIGNGAALGVGRRRAIEPADIDTLRRVANRPPSSPKHFSDLLAGTSRRAALRDPNGISSECHVVYLPTHPPARGPEWRVYRYGWGQVIPTGADPRFLLFGMDMTAMLAAFVKELPGLKAGSTPDPEFAMAGIRLEPGHRVMHLEDRRLGRVHADPAPGGEVNDIAVRWDGSWSVERVHRSSVKVLYPGE